MIRDRVRAALLAAAIGQSVLHCFFVAAAGRAVGFGGLASVAAAEVRGVGTGLLGCV
jgi:hypothetical protein